MLKIIRWVAVGLIVLLAAGWGAIWQARRDPAGPLADAVRAIDARLSGRAEGQIPSGGLIGGPFTLTDDHGRTVTDASYHGRWSLMYFGYTYCPDVCPTELQTIAMALDGLGPLAAQVVPIFITVDPERDTVDSMRQYVALFDPRLIGLTGTPVQIDTIAHEYRVYHKKVTTPQATSYLVDHSSLVYLMNPAGGFSRLFSAETGADEMAAGIARAIAEDRQEKDG